MTFSLSTVATISFVTGVKICMTLCLDHMFHLDDADAKRTHNNRIDNCHHLQWKVVPQELHTHYGNTQSHVEGDLTRERHKAIPVRA